MTLRILILAALSLVLTVSCNRKPKSDKDQASYTIGAQFGKSLKSQNLDLDTSALSRGLVDGYKGEGTKLSEEEMQKSMERLSGDRQKEQQAASDANKLKAEEFMLNNRTKDGVQVTASGLQYIISNPGSGASPKGDDVVVVNYKGTLMDGTEFDSSYKRGIQAEFPLKGVIPGWAEGLQLLKTGGKAIFFVPPELGYGDRPRQTIPGNSVLIFDVELVGIRPPAAKTPPPKKK